jgi:hypothetical protein
MMMLGCFLSGVWVRAFYAWRLNLDNWRIANENETAIAKTEKMTKKCSPNTNQKTNQTSSLL